MCICNTYLLPALPAERQLCFFFHKTCKNTQLTKKHPKNLKLRIFLNKLVAVLENSAVSRFQRALQVLMQ